MCPVGQISVMFIMGRILTGTRTWFWYETEFLTSMFDPKPHLNRKCFNPNLTWTWIFTRTAEPEIFKSVRFAEPEIFGTFCVKLSGDPNLKYLKILDSFGPGSILDPVTNLRYLCTILGEVKLGNPSSNQVNKYPPLAVSLLKGSGLDIYSVLC